MKGYETLSISDRKMIGLQKLGLFLELCYGMAIVSKVKRISPFFLDLKKGRQMMSLTLSRVDSTYPPRFNSF